MDIGREHTPIAPNNDTHIIHEFPWIQLRYPVLKKESVESPVVSKIWKVRIV
jgi:hypothetical protein